MEQQQPTVEQITTVAAVTTFKPNESTCVNGKEVEKDQPMKVSKIEVLENKVNTSVNPVTSETKIEPSEPTAPVNQSPQPKITATPTKSSSKEPEKAKPTNEEIESTIVTADYIQQSM